MNVTKIAGSIVLLAGFAAPVFGVAQESYHERHERAKAAQRRSDHRHHTGAKIVGGSAAGGAVIGGLAGGGKGALIGAAVGAGGGAVANKVRTDKDVKRRENNDPR